MSEQDKISVIMGVHNGSSRIEESINSIIGQTYKNWEFIICDDGSTDDSFEKMRTLYGEDPRFVILKNEYNIGLAATLNRCIKKSTGTIIARMDDDDYCYSDRFEKQLKFLKNHPEISFVSSSVDIYDGQDIIGKRVLTEYPTKIDLIWNSPFVHPATMFRKEELLRAHCYRVAPETVRGQDYDLFMRMYGMGYRGANLKDPVYRFTVDDSSLKRRTLKARLGEMKIRRIGYGELGVLPFAAPMIAKPLVAYFVMGIRNSIKKRGY